MFIPSAPLLVGVALLYLGLIFAVARSRGRGQSAIIYFFLFWTFIQYFLSPVIAFFSGGWESFLLVPDSAELAMVVAMAYVASVVSGYGICRAAEKKEGDCTI